MTKRRNDDKRAGRAIIKDEISPAEPNFDPSFDLHIYEGERCLFCNVNVYDDMIYGPFECSRNEPYNYTTETP